MSLQKARGSKRNVSEILQLLGYNTVQSVEIEPTFTTNILLQSSSVKGKPQFLRNERKTENST
jgi:hypothetical protein